MTYTKFRHGRIFCVNRMKPLLIPSCLIFILLLVGCSQPNPVYNDSSPGKRTSTSPSPITEVSEVSESNPAQTNPKTTPPERTTRTNAPMPTKPNTRQPNLPRRSITQTAASALSTNAPNALPTKTPHPDLPPAPIQIFGPGPGSKVTSPIQVEAQLTSQGGKLLRIELRGEDGRLLSRIVKLPNVYPWSSAQLSLPLFFEISTPTESARLTISVDDQHGRTMDLNSIDLILQAAGDPALYPASSLEQALVIQQPKAGQRISEGSAAVQGVYHGDILLPIRAELISQDGKILGYRMAANSINPNEDFGQFSAEISYSIERKIPARLVVYIDSENGGQTLHLSSVEIVLDP